jgi:streptogramin lyase
MLLVMKSAFRRYWYLSLVIVLLTQSLVSADPFLENRDATVFAPKTGGVPVFRQATSEPVPRYVMMLEAVPPVPARAEGTTDNHRRTQIRTKHKDTKTQRNFLGVPSLPVIPRKGEGRREKFGVDSFPSPDTTPFGLEWANGALWHSDLRAREIYQLNPQTGQVLRSFSAPDDWTKDLAFDGTNLYACGNYQSRIYKLDTASGSVIASYSAPGSNPVGLCFDGAWLWNADWNSDQSQPSYIYKLDPSNGQVIASFVTPAVWPAGLAWDGSCLWNVDMKLGMIYRLDPNTGEVRAVVGAAGPKPTGVTWHDDRLWNADWTRAMIYLFRTDSGLPAVALNVPVNHDALPCWRSLAILGTVAGAELIRYSVEYGLGENPVSWTPIGGFRTAPVYLDTLAVWDVSGIMQAAVYTLRINAEFSSHTDTVQRVTISLDPEIRAGWPQTFTNVSVLGGADVNGDLETELFAGLYHQDGLNQRLAGWNLNGATLNGFPVLGINNNQMAPAFGVVRHNDTVSVATGYDLNNDQVNLVRPDGQLMPGWPQTGGRPGSNYYLGLPVLADVNHDSLLEVFTGGGSLSGWRSDGVALPGFPLPGQSSSPAIGDVNRDGNPELVVLSGGTLNVLDSVGNSLPGFPKTYSGASQEQYPVLGDVNGDNRLEVVFNLGTRLYAVTDTGAALPGFPRTLSGNYANSPVLGDLDGDGHCEIVVTSGSFPSYSEIAAFRYDGSPVTGFPVRLNGRVFRSFNEPVLGDVNGDDQPEIVMGFELENTFEEVHALQNDGTPVLGWPKRLRDIYGYGVTGSPVLGDFDNDDTLDMAISSNAYWIYKTDVYVWNLKQRFNAQAMPWPTQRHDVRRSACLSYPTLGLSGSVARGPGPMLSARPNPFRSELHLYLAGSDWSPLEFYDAAGRRVRTLPARPELVWNGADAQGRHLPSGAYFVRAGNRDRLVSLRVVLKRE